MADDARAADETVQGKDSVVARTAWLSLWIGLVVSVQAQAPAALVIRVLVDGAPAAGAMVTVGARSVQTGADGRAPFDVEAGPVRILVSSPGFVDVRQSVTVPQSGIEVVVELTAIPEMEEEVVVAATTRTGRRVEDQPTRVEVLGREEIEEKMLMTPGDIVMMLNEMGGLRVQATSPSIGAASVRVQGMKGRYTRFLSDGLPLFGQQVRAWWECGKTKPVAASVSSSTSRDGSGSR